MQLHQRHNQDSATYVHKGRFIDVQRRQEGWTGTEMSPDGLVGVQLAVTSSERETLEAVTASLA